MVRTVIHFRAETKPLEHRSARKLDFVSMALKVEVDVGFSYAHNHQGLAGSGLHCPRREELAEDLQRRRIRSRRRHSRA